jgi:hypothetical protein
MKSIKLILTVLFLFYLGSFGQGYRGAGGTGGASVSENFVTNVVQDLTTVSTNTVLSTIGTSNEFAKVVLKSSIIGGLSSGSVSTSTVLDSLALSNLTINVETILTRTHTNVGSSLAVIDYLEDSLAGLSNSSPTFEETTNIAVQVVANTLLGNVIVNLTTTKMVTANVPTNSSYVGACSGQPLITQSTITNTIVGTNDYIFTFGCTNRSFTEASAQYITITAFMCETGSGSLAGEWEIYRKDVATGALNEWSEASGSSFTVDSGSTPLEVITPVYVPNVNTNAFYIDVRFKRTSGAATTFLVGAGTNYNSHMEFEISSALLLEPYVLKTQITQTITTNVTEIPSGAAVTAALEGGGFTATNAALYFTDTWNGTNYVAGLRFSAESNAFYFIRTP